MKCSKRSQNGIKKSETNENFDELNVKIQNFFFSENQQQQKKQRQISNNFLFVASLLNGFVIFIALIHTWLLWGI